MSLITVDVTLFIHYILSFISFVRPFFFLLFHAVIFVNVSFNFTLLDGKCMRMFNSIDSIIIHTTQYTHISSVFFFYPLLLFSFIVILLFQFFHVIMPVVYTHFFALLHRMMSAIVFLVDVAVVFFFFSI